MRQRPPFPDVIDSSLIGTFRSCPQKAFRQYFQHWKPGEDSVHLIAGGAFAAGIEVARQSFYVDGEDAQTAMARGVGALTKKYGYFDPPVDPWDGTVSAKSWVRTAGALEYYFEKYPLGADGATPHIFGSGKRGIEFSFCEPLSIRHPETGDPLLYAGRADMVADALGGLFLYDEKTATSLGKSWLRQWELRSQFTSYCWGLRGYGFRPTGIVVRGIAILKESYNTAQVITNRSDWEVDRWLWQLERDLKRMIECWQSGYWDYNLDHACTEYGGCAYTLVCKSPEPDNWLPIYFHRRRWDPLTREETVLDNLEP